MRDVKVKRRKASGQPQNAAAIAARQRRAVQRERDLITHLNAGKSLAEAARLVGIAERTAGNYVARLSSEQGVRGVEALIACLRHQKLLPTPSGARRPRVLNDTEKHALSLVAGDKSTDEIARIMGRSREAVYAIIKGALRKLNVATREAAVARAAAVGELSVELPSTVPNPLTERECQILALIHEGYSPSEIAENIDRASLTVLAHLTDARHKLRVATNSEAASAAITMGAITAKGKRRQRVRREAVEAVRSAPATIELTAREVDVLWELRATRDTRKLARRLRIGEKTVSYYCGAIARALGVSGRIATLARAEELGLIPSSNLGADERLGLTVQQLRILKHFERGRSHDDVAAAEQLAYSTVTTYAHTILKAMGAPSITLAVERLRAVDR